MLGFTRRSYSAGTPDVTCHIYGADSCQPILGRFLRLGGDPLVIRARIEQGDPGVLQTCSDSSECAWTSTPDARYTLKTFCPECHAKELGSYFVGSLYKSCAALSALKCNIPFGLCLGRHGLRQSRTNAAAHLVLGSAFCYLLLRLLFTCNRSCEKLGLGIIPVYSCILQL